MGDLVNEEVVVERSIAVGLYGSRSAISGSRKVPVIAYDGVIPDE